MKIIFPLNHSVLLKNLRLSASIRGSKVLLLCIFCLFVGSSAFAGLKWKTTSQHIKVNPLQASVTVTFVFTNTGGSVVTILGLKPSCGCISGKVDKKNYAPGESGSVQMVFNMQDRVGAEHKGLAVKTDDDPSNPTQLYLNTVIPASYTFPVKRVTWEVGEQHNSKSIRLTNASKTPFPLEKAIPARDDIRVKLKPIREGFEYDLVITPFADLSKTLVPITIHPAKPAGVDSVRTYTVYALVK